MILLVAMALAAEPDVAALRAAEIVRYEGFVAARPEDVEALSHLALLLSWTPGRLDDAITTWRRAVAASPQNRGARLGLARSLAWAGANRESAELFDALLAENAADPEALLGRSQLARWTGDRVTARELLERAEALSPSEPRVRAERARIELDSGRVGVAKRVAGDALVLAPGLYEGAEAMAAIHAVTAPRVSLRATATQESTGFNRTSVAAPVELHLLPDTRLRLEPGYTLIDGAGRVDAGVEVRQTGLPQGIWLRGAYTLHALLNVGQTHAVDLAVGTSHPLDAPVEIQLGARRRALVDLPVGDDTIAPLNVVGSGGATSAGLIDLLEMNEAYASLAVAPLPGLYLYGDGVVGAGDDGNGRRTVAAGVGQDVLRWLPKQSTQALTLKYDLYFLSVATPDERFFSPTSFLTQTPGLEWRWSPGAVTVGVEGGLPLRIDAPVGWLVGGFGNVRIGEHLGIAARVRVLDDTAWRATGGTLSLSGRW